MARVRIEFTVVRGIGTGKSMRILQNACHENDCCFFHCFQGLRGWGGVCGRLQLQFGNVGGGAVVTGATGQRSLATAHCSHSYCSLDRSVFFCSANFARAAGESNEMARRMSACSARQGCTALLSGNIGEKCSVGDFFFGAHGAPYRRWSRVAGVAAFLRAYFAAAWGARWRFGRYLRSTVGRRLKT